jgi:hypothetical protein
MTFSQLDCCEDVVIHERKNFCPCEYTLMNVLLSTREKLILCYPFLKGMWRNKYSIIASVSG